MIRLSKSICTRFPKQFLPFPIIHLPFVQLLFFLIYFYIYLCTSNLKKTSLPFSLSNKLSTKAITSFLILTNTYCSSVFIPKGINDNSRHMFFTRSFTFCKRGYPYRFVTLLFSKKRIVSKGAIFFILKRESLGMMCK